jgi:hypothetical protein
VVIGLSRVGDNNTEETLVDCRRVVGSNMGSVDCLSLWSWTGNGHGIFILRTDVLETRQWFQGSTTLGEGLGLGLGLALGFREGLGLGHRLPYH